MPPIDRGDELIAVLEQLDPFLTDPNLCQVWRDGRVLNDRLAIPCVALAAGLVERPTSNQHGSTLRAEASPAVDAVATFLSRLGGVLHPWPGDPLDRIWDYTRARQFDKDAS